jgi:hypothetical protein
MEVGMNAFNLIDRYIAEVGKDLPRKNRLDIEAEILSALEDMLTERSHNTGTPVDEQMIVEVLKEYGSPRKVAASYLPERYLIGPQLYSAFLSAMKLILPILAAVALVKIGLSLGQVSLTFENIFVTLFEGVFEFLGSAMTALGSMVVLFAILQRTLPEFKEEPGEWDPRKLPEATSRNRVEVWSSVLEACAAAFGIVLFNFFPGLITISYQNAGQWWIGIHAGGTAGAWSATLLSESFFHYLPALTILLALVILQDVVLISRGRWETWTRWSAFSLNIAAITLAGIMLAGPALTNISVETLISGGFPDLFVAKVMVSLINQGTILALVITMIACTIKAIRLLIRLTGRDLSPALEKCAHP